MTKLGQNMLSVAVFQLALQDPTPGYGNILWIVTPQINACKEKLLSAMACVAAIMVAETRLAATAITLLPALK